MRTSQKLSNTAARFLDVALSNPVNTKEYQRSAMQKNRTKILTDADLAWVYCR